MSYWFMRMKQGKGGHDFSEELWSRGKVGVLFGTWRISHVLNEDGQIDPSKLTADAIENVCPQPKDEHAFTNKFLRPAKTFLRQVEVGHRVVVAFGQGVHVGTIGEGYLDDFELRGQRQEPFKCRPIYKCKSFRFADLPSVYRLIPNIGQGTIQQIHGLIRPIRLLDSCNSALDVKATLAAMSAEQFLEMLSPQQWEVICGEYLREKIGFRFLLLQSGKTLKDVDLVGVNARGKRVIAQCKNDNKPWSASQIVGWLDSASLASTDEIYFFSRGGITGGTSNRCVVVDGQAIASWLRSSPEYFQCVKTL